MSSNLSGFLDSFISITKRPHDYLSIQEELSEQIKNFIKEVYDYTKGIEECSDKNTLSQLLVKEFDEEQIWQELELQNACCTDDIVQNFSHFSAKKDKLKFPIKLKCNATKKKDVEINEDTVYSTKDEVVGAQDKNEDEEDDFNEEDDEDDMEEDLSEDVIPQKKRFKPSIVDDKFFKLAELEVFLQNEDTKEDKPSKDKEHFDLFDDNVGQEGADYKYSDFFDAPEDGIDELDTEDIKEGSNDEFDESEDDFKNSEADYEESNLNLTKHERKRKHVENSDEKENDAKEKRVRFALLDSGDEIKSEDETASESTERFTASKKSEIKNNKLKSSFEERQERLGRVIEKLEDEALSEKPWQLKGEVTGSSRPQNSLLEEAVDFDFSVRPAPVISEEVTLRLEDIIMQRIKDKAWDDVERKVKPVDAPTEFKKKLALDQEKSKLSLAEVYEQEFIKQREAATKDDTERQEEEPALHVETRSMLHSLFNKLDALSNYHFTPRPVAPELKVVSNVSAVVMEEVAPVTVADSALLAPQEIKGKRRRGELMSKEERTDTDKKRALRLKKTRQRRRQRDRAKAAKEIAKINPGLGNKYSKLKVQKDILNTSSNISKMDESKEKVVKSSTAFFNKLQDEVKSHIKTKTSFTKKKDKRNITAKKLKL